MKSSKAEINKAALANPLNPFRKTAIDDVANASGVPNSMRLGPSHMSGSPQQNREAIQTPAIGTMESAKANRESVI